MSQRSLPVDIAFGTGHWDNDSAHVVTQREIVQALHRHKITLLDTSRHYVRFQLFILVNPGHID